MGGKIYWFWMEKPLEFPISARKSLRISAKTFFFEITCFWPEKPLEFPISAWKSPRISAKTFFFWRSPVLGWKNRLNFRFRPEKAFGFRRRPFFFFFEITCFSLKNRLIPFQEQWKFGSSSSFQKILATCLFFTKVQSTLKKRPPM